jgi:hypothetical protein
VFSDGKKKQAGRELFLGVDGSGVDHLGSVLDEALDLAGFGKLLKAFISLGIVSLKKLTLIALRAREPRSFIRSETMEGVMTL